MILMSPCIVQNGNTKVAMDFLCYERCLGLKDQILEGRQKEQRMLFLVGRGLGLTWVVEQCL